MVVGDVNSTLACSIVAKKLLIKVAHVEAGEMGAGPAKGEYAFMTLHRPSNVDDGDTFREIAAALNEMAAEMPILFPAHPRTRKMMEKFQIKFSENIKLFFTLPSIPSRRGRGSKAEYLRRGRESKVEYLPSREGK